MIDDSVYGIGDSWAHPDDVTTWKEGSWLAGEAAKAVTLEELEKLMEKAYRQGYEAGYKDGVASVDDYWMGWR